MGRFSKGNLIFIVSLSVIKQKNTGKESIIYGQFIVTHFIVVTLLLVICSILWVRAIVSIKETQSKVGL
jgi:hypothetical protein